MTRAALLVPVFAGGALGGSLRVALGELLSTPAGSWPWATFGANLAGALILGATYTVYATSEIGNSYGTQSLPPFTSSFTTISYSSPSGILIWVSLLFMATSASLKRVLPGLRLNYSSQKTSPCRLEK